MEIQKHVDFDFFIRFAEGLQKFLGDKCEIVIHDFRKGFEHTIVHIINGQLSGRTVGGPPRGAMISNSGKDIEPFKESRIYFYNGTTGSSGQIFKSCTTLISDENNRIIGSVCLNLEMTDFILAQNALQNFVHYINPDIATLKEEDVAFENVDDVMRYYMDQCEQLVGKPMSLMNKQEKIKALEYLESKGVFKITKASVLLCQAFQVSKFTLYSYLEEAKGLRKLTDMESAET
jgi:predicted transcriptional regulator YheO